MAAALIKARLAGLDDDVLEYVLSLTGDGAWREEGVQEQLAAFLVSSEFCADDESGGEFVRALVGELEESAGGAAGASAAASAAAAAAAAGLPRKLDKVLTFDAAPQNDDLFKAVQFNNDSYSTTGEAKLTKAELRKNERAAQAKEAASQRVEEEAQVKLNLSDIQITSSVSEGADRSNGNITLEGFDLAHKLGGADLLSHASLTLVAGRRYGLVGRNGCGKSTFLEALNAKRLDGMKDVRQSILLVKQEVEGNDLTPLEWVLGSDGRRERLRAALARDPTQLALQDQLGELERTKGAAEAAKILFGLGFDQAKQTAPTSGLSGGWRRRVAIACALFVEPQILCLDEPTNHLDLETVLWLEHFILSDRFTSTLLVVSHDRSFLDAVVTDIVAFRQQRLECYKGDYVSYLEQMEQERASRAKLRETQEARRATLQEYIDKHSKAGANGPKAAKQRKSKMKKMERLGVEAAAQAKGGKFKASYDGEAEEVEEEVNEDEFELCFPSVPKVDGTLIQLDDVAFAYPGGAGLLRGVTCGFDIHSRVALMGRNGCGKSTLLKLMLGLLSPSAGRIQVKPTVRIEYISQHHSDMLDLDSTALETMLDRFPGDGSMSHMIDMRRYLAAFGLQGNVLPKQQIRKLSGGQKFRVALALAMYTQPHFLVLDEPSNHLDMETLSALVDALTKFTGGYVMVSHDEFLISKTCKEIFVVNGGLTRLEGGFSRYKKALIKG
jgi:ATP-binding cassette subfamily F protein 3